MRCARPARVVPLALVTAFVLLFCSLGLVPIAKLAVPANASVSGPVSAEWTVMVYLDGDSNLEAAAIASFDEMEAAPSSLATNVVVQFDRTPLYDSSNGDWTTTRRYLVTHDDNLSTIGSPMISDLGELNMGDPSTLADFVTWCMQNYPANHYFLVLWDHGNGWRQSNAQTRGLCYDYSSGGDALSMQELRDALDQIKERTNSKVDLLGFDACLMAMLEVDYQISQYADYRVSSEESEPVDGWNYRDMLTALASNASMSPADLAAHVVMSYLAPYGISGDQTMGASNLNKIYDVKSGVNTLAQCLLSDLNNALSRTAIQTCRSNTQSYSDPEFIDLYDFSWQISSNPVLPADTREAANTLIAAIDNYVVEEIHGTASRRSHGISIYYPSRQQSYESSYDDLPFPQDTQWDEFLKRVRGEIPYASYADVYVEHTWVGDLNVTIGVGDPANPLWSQLIWNRTGGSAHNLDLTIDLLSAAVYLPPSRDYQWYLKVYDASVKDQGNITQFKITHQGRTYSSNGTPVSIYDLAASFAHISDLFVPLPTAEIYINHTWVGDLSATIGVGDPANPLWSQLVWNRTGGNQKNLNLTADLSTAIAYLPPSDIYKWYLKVYDASARDQGNITEFRIKYRGNTYNSNDTPVPIYDLKTSCAFVPSGKASAHIYIEHAYRGDLIVDVGVGNPASPVWSKRVWNGMGGNADNLDLTVDLSSAASYLPATKTNRWFLKVFDRANGDQGKIVEFTIIVPGANHSSIDVPVPILDLKTSYAFVPSLAQANVYIEHTYRGDLIVDIGVGSTSSPLWSKRVWNGAGGNADNLDLYVGLSSAVAYLPPSGTYSWWVKVYDRATGDQGKITAFIITYQDRIYTSSDVPVPISDLKTSYAYING